MRPKIMEEVEALRGINSVAIKEAMKRKKSCRSVLCIFSTRNCLSSRCHISIPCGTTQEPIEEAEKDYREIYVP